jgi:hypothetical protein
MSLSRRENKDQLKVETLGVLGGRAVSTHEWCGAEGRSAPRISIDRPVNGLIRRDVSWLDLQLDLMLNLRLRMAS